MVLLGEFVGFKTLILSIGEFEICFVLGVCVDLVSVLDFFILVYS